jgi:transcriptional regulator GlxA family with amidase domain
LLITTRNSIIDVALQCGFLSNSHFSRCFRNMYGKTPSQVRDEAVRKTGASGPIVQGVSPAVTS